MDHQYLVRLDDPYEPESSENYVRTGFIGADEVWLFAGEDPLLTLSGTLIGEWDDTGLMITVDQSLYDQIRPLGNNPDGSATGLLAYHNIAGWDLRELRERTALDHLKLKLIYPVDNTPFTITTRHKYFDNEWPGWGWRSEMDAHEDDPSVRAIGVYTDPECTQYEYTTGAFVFGPSEFYPGHDVWYTETPPGRAYAEKTDWNLAVLYAALQEGYSTLKATDDQITHSYWKENQGGGNNPGPADWTDSGQTVAGNYGTVTGVQDKSVFSVGMNIRIEGLESVITELWAGGDGIILEPYRSYTVGSAIEYKG